MRSILFSIAFLLFCSTVTKAEALSEALYSGTIVAFEKVQGGWDEGVLLTAPSWHYNHQTESWENDTWVFHEHLWQTLYIEVKFPERGETVYTYKMELDLVDFLVSPGDEIIIIEEFIGDLFTDSIFRAQIGGQERVFDIKKSDHKVGPTIFWQQPTPYHPPPAPGGWA